MKKQFLLFALLFILFLVLPGAYEKLADYMRRQNGGGLQPFSVPSQKRPLKTEPQTPVKHGFTMPFDNRLNAALAFIKKIEDEVNAGTSEKKSYYLNDLKEFCESGENDSEIFLAILNNRYGVSDFCRAWAAAALGYLNDGNYTNALVNAYKSETSDIVRLAVLQGFLKISDAYSLKGLTYTVSLKLQCEPSENLAPEALNCFIEEIDIRGNTVDRAAAQLVDAIAPMQKTSDFLTFKLLEILADKNCSRTVRLAATEAFAYSQPGIGTIELEQIIQRNSLENLDFEFDPANRYHEAILAARALVAKIRAGDEMAKIEAKRIMLGNVPPSIKETLLDFHEIKEAITPEDMALFLSLTNDASIEVRSRAVASIFVYSGDDPVVNEIVHDVITKEKDPESKAKLIKAITVDFGGQLPVYSQDNMDFLVGLLEGDENDIVKKQVIESLAALKYVEALPYLESIAASGSESLQRAAEDAVFSMSDKFSEHVQTIVDLSHKIGKDDSLKQLEELIYNGPSSLVRHRALSALGAESPEGEAMMLDILKTSEDFDMRITAFTNLLYSSNYDRNGKHLSEILKTPMFEKNNFTARLIKEVVEGKKVYLGSYPIPQLDGKSAVLDAAISGEKNLCKFLDGVFETAGSVELKKSVLKAYQTFSDKETAASIAAKLNGLLEDETLAELKPDIQQAINWLKYNSGQ